MVEKNMSTVDLSVKMGKSKNAMTAMLARDSSPTLDTLQSIADALGYDMELSFVDCETGKRIDA